MKFTFHPEALEEYREAARYYETQRSGLGMSFIIEIEATIQRIQEAPKRWHKIAEGIRSCRTRTFPYAVLYATDSGVLHLIAVMHLHREPGYWRGRRATPPEP